MPVGPRPTPYSAWKFTRATFAAPAPCRPARFDPKTQQYASRPWGMKLSWWKTRSDVAMVFNSFDCSKLMRDPDPAATAGPAKCARMHGRHAHRPIQSTVAPRIRERLHELNQRPGEIRTGALFRERHPPRPRHPRRSVLQGIDLQPQC